MFRDNWFDRNLSTGLWLDVSCLNNTIYRNAFTNNGSFGCFYEISAGATIAFNLAIGNRIALSGSSNCRVFNNTVIGSGILVTDSGRHNNPLLDDGVIGGGGNYDGVGFEGGEDSAAEFSAGTGAAAQGARWECLSNSIENNIVTDPSVPFVEANYNYNSDQHDPNAPDFGQFMGKPVTGHQENSSLMFSSLDYNVYSGTTGNVKWYTNGSTSSYGSVNDFAAGTGGAYEGHGVYQDHGLSGASTLFSSSYRPAQNAPYAVRSAGSGLFSGVAMTPPTDGFSNPWNGGGNSDNAYALGAAPQAGSYRGAFKPVLGTPNLVVDSVSVAPEKPVAGAGGDF